MARDKAHTFVVWPLIARRRCRYCGLVWLRNAASDEAARKPCRWWS